MKINRCRSLAILLTVATSVLAGSSVASAAAPACNGSPKLCSRTLDKVVLPGSHNAMSSSKLGWGIPNHVITMAEQLKRGVRALLIDTHYGVPGSYELGGQKINFVTTVEPSDPKRQLYLCHNKCEMGATPLANSLKTILSFVRRHPREVFVIINEDYTKPAGFAAAVVKSGLKKYLYSGSQTKFPTLAKMIASGQRVVMMSEGDNAPAGSAISKWYFKAYAKALNETPYSFLSADLLTAPANLAASCVTNRGPAKAPLFLMNNFVTRPPLGISSPDDAVSVNAKAAIVARARACQSVRGKLPTILAVNNVETGDVVGAAKSLNGLR